MVFFAIGNFHGNEIDLIVWEALDWIVTIHGFSTFVRKTLEIKTRFCVSLSALVLNFPLWKMSSCFNVTNNANKLKNWLLVRWSNILEQQKICWQKQNIQKLNPPFKKLAKNYEKQNLILSNSKMITINCHSQNKMKITLGKIVW
jgi:hypothetical protein